MKISILFQPRNSGITGALVDCGWKRVQFDKWDYRITRNTVIQRVKKEDLGPLVKEVKEIGGMHKVLICTSFQDYANEFNRIENLFI